MKGRVRLPYPILPYPPIVLPLLSDALCLADAVRPCLQPGSSMFMVSAWRGRHAARACRRAGLGSGASGHAGGARAGGGVAGQAARDGHEAGLRAHAARPPARAAGRPAARARPGARRPWAPHRTRGRTGRSGARLRGGAGKAAARVSACCRRGVAAVRERRSRAPSGARVPCLPWLARHRLRVCTSLCGVMRGASMQARGLPHRALCRISARSGTGGRAGECRGSEALEACAPAGARAARGDQHADPGQRGGRGHRGHARHRPQRAPARNGLAHAAAGAPAAPLLCEAGIFASPVLPLAATRSSRCPKVLPKFQI